MVQLRVYRRLLIAKGLGCFTKALLFGMIMPGSCTANCTSDQLRCYGCEVMRHPLCGPYLTPSDLHLSEAHKKHLASKQFAADANMKQAVTSWIQTVDTDFFVAVTQAFTVVGQMLSVNGDYIEV